MLVTCVNRVVIAQSTKANSQLGIEAKFTNSSPITDDRPDFYTERILNNVNILFNSKIDNG